MTIPDLVESEELLSMSADTDGKTFRVAIRPEDTATRLMQAREKGQELPLVVLTTDAGMIALDSVYVADVVVGGQPPVAEVTFNAQAVRFV